MLSKLKTQIIVFIKQPINWVCIIYSLIFLVWSKFALDIYYSGNIFWGICFLSTGLVFWFCVYAYKISKAFLYYIDNKKLNIFDITFLWFIGSMLYNIIKHPFLYIPSALLFAYMMTLL